MNDVRVPPLLIRGGILLGLGLGGFFDGVVLHQILQWHHLVSSVPAYPVTTVPGLQANTLWDGLFHAGTYLFTVAGLASLWLAARRPHGPWSARLLVGLLLMGWGSFNLLEGVANHLVLGIHHVNERAPADRWAAWDFAFLLWGAAMLAGGWGIARSGERASENLARRTTTTPPHDG